MKKQYGIRMGGEINTTLHNFADEHRMSPTAAAELFVKLGIDSLNKNEAMDARIDKLENQLRQVYQSLSKATIYLTSLPQHDQEKARAASEQAEKATVKIFGEEHESDQ